MKILDDAQAEQVRSLCELIVPGCARIGAEVYIDALLARMPAAARGDTLAAFAALDPAAQQGAAALAEHAFTAEFGLVRALACEAFYSDFVAPGAAGPGAWQEIDFAPRVAADLRKDWSYLGVGE
jgi:hypothetical protein